MKVKRAFPVRMLALPLGLVVTFVASVVLLATHWLLALALFALSLVFFNFNLHVFLHECVHTRADYPGWVRFIFCLALGLPFTGYRMHHYNHHKFNNSLDDYSTTWMRVGDQVQARGLFSYCFGWMRQIVNPTADLTPYGLPEPRHAHYRRLIQTEKLWILAIFVAMSLWSVTLILMYLGLVYFGWALIALQNYGQHPPLEDVETSTFTSRWYNRLLFNNGLHWEHHHEPGKPWYLLEEQGVSPRIGSPHLIEPFKKMSRRIDCDG